MKKNNFLYELFCFNKKKYKQKIYKKCIFMCIKWVLKCIFLVILIIIYKVDSLRITNENIEILVRHFARTVKCSSSPWRDGFCMWTFFRWFDIRSLHVNWVGPADSAKRFLCLPCISFHHSQQPHARALSIIIIIVKRRKVNCATCVISPGHTIIYTEPTSSDSCQ